MINLSVQLRENCKRLKNWLFQDALPIWERNGIDYESGGFFERLKLDGLGINETQRARVPCRQLYCFIEAGRLGWEPWKPIVLNGYQYFCENFVDSNGAIISEFDPISGVKNSEFDLYNQAFALFLFAHVANAVSELSEDAEQRATTLLLFLKDNFPHPSGGFNESFDGKLPLRSNPHMHLFEAFLAWESFSNKKFWRDETDKIASLCMSRFIEKKTGILREFFDQNWNPMAGDAGRIIEPGHLFEWAWLLVIWGKLRGGESAISVARQLFKLGIQYGYDVEREVLVMQLNDDFTVRNSLSRLWPHTELIKAAILLAKNSNNSEKNLCEEYVIKGIFAIERFFDVHPKGLWRDKLNSNGKFEIEPVPASSFYHIMCALSELFSHYLESDVN